MTPSARVLIAHADPLARAYVRGLATNQLHLSVAAEAESFDALLEQLRDHAPVALIIVDLDLPGMSFEVGLRSLQSDYGGVPVAVLSGTPGHDTLDGLWADGNTAPIPKQLPEASLVHVLGRMLARPDSAPESTNTAEAQLTSRQYDVLRLLSEGRSNREISEILGIAEGTVKVHVNAVFRILGVHNRVSATVAFRANAAPL